MSESLEMSQELAQRLFLEGSTCVCLGVAKGAEFGIDMKSWTTDSKFLGIKMIPDGFHYFHYSMANPHGDLAPRAGFLWFTHKSEIRVKKWNEATGLFEDESADETEKVKSNLKQLDRNLGPYPYEVWDKWKSLTDQITENLAEKFLPDSGVISSVLELNGSSDADRKDPEPANSNEPRKRQRRSAPFSDVNFYGDLLPSLHATAGTELRFSKLPEHSYPDGSTPAEITRHSLDSSYLLGVILSQHDRADEVLGELQFAFVSFLVGHCMEGFEHWKRLLGVFSSVQKDLPRNITFYTNLLSVLKPQLAEIPVDFLVDIVESNNFVYQSLRKLFCNIANECSNGRLQSKARRLQEYLTQTFLWEFDDLNEEDEDEQPVIVET